MAGSSAASDVSLTNYLEVDLEKFVKKGTQDEWKEDLEELSSKITITLNVGTGLDSTKTYVVVREHNGVYEQIPATYDKKAGTLTFQSDKFSEYAIGTLNSKQGVIPSVTAKKDATITFASSSVSKTLGSRKFTNKLTIETDGQITYKSSNKKVAVVSRTGVVTVKSVGTTIITVASAETARYKACTASYKITVKPKKTSISKVQNLRSRKLKITWKKNKSVNGYQIQYSKDKKFKKGVASKKITKAKITSATYKKLKKKKTYYVRIRTYKKVRGKTYYSNWSSVKKVKIKK